MFIYPVIENDAFISTSFIFFSEIGETVQFTVGFNCPLSEDVEVSIIESQITFNPTTFKLTPSHLSQEVNATLIGYDVFGITFVDFNCGESFQKRILVDVTTINKLTCFPYASMEEFYLDEKKGKLSIYTYSYAGVFFNIDDTQCNDAFIFSVTSGDANYNRDITVRPVTNIDASCNITLTIFTDIPEKIDLQTTITYINVVYHSSNRPGIIITPTSLSYHDENPKILSISTNSIPSSIIEITPYTYDDFILSAINPKSCELNAGNNYKCDFEIIPTNYNYSYNEYINFRITTSDVYYSKLYINSVRITYYNDNCITVTPTKLIYYSDVTYTIKINDYIYFFLNYLFFSNFLNFLN